MGHPSLGVVVGGGPRAAVILQIDTMIWFEMPGDFCENIWMAPTPIPRSLLTLTLSQCPVSCKLALVWKKQRLIKLIGDCLTVVGSPHPLTVNRVVK